VFEKKQHGISDQRP